MKMANQRIHGLDKELKQARSDLFDAHNAADIATEHKNKAFQEVAELKKVASDEVF